MKRTALTAVLFLAPALQGWSYPLNLPSILEERAGIETHGFVDVRAGWRTQQDPNQGDASLGEIRSQLDFLRYGNYVTTTLRLDLVEDWEAEDHEPDLEEGSGWLDLREANLSFAPLSFMDVKAGRQILTWGTGDLLFVNDLFPKDWQSFFLGRDEEYLKAPSDALFVSLFPAWASIDIAYTPRFDPDRFLTGERVSFYNPVTGMSAGENAVISASVPDDYFDDDEWAMRAYRLLGSYETAVYGYRGFWKSPAGFLPTGEAAFPELAVYGASARGPLHHGLVNVEAGYYDSLDDRAGTDPMIRNSEIRLLAGYEQEVATDFTAGLQFYVEAMQDYDEYLAGLPEGAPVTEEYRQLVTLRLTRMMLSQNLTLSLFVFYSPTDDDGYARPAVSYKVNDNLLLTAGGNLFAGKNETSFFGQFEDNSNLYAGARWSF